MSPASAPVYTFDEFDAARQMSMEAFRVSRMREPLEDYLNAFDTYRAAIENLLELTVDLSQLVKLAVEVLTEVELIEAVRYLASPPVSADDLKILAEASLAPGRLKEDPAMARRVIETVLLGLDRNRFPWVAEDREPTEGERSAAAMASAALMASRRVLTKRANESKTQQEHAVSELLINSGFKEVNRRTIRNVEGAPARGEFCGESLVGDRKADIVIRLHDGRIMPTECKVSNSYTNSVKRLNNDAGVKARYWLDEFGPRHVVPSAVLTGVFKTHNLLQAQERGLTIFWSHALEDMILFIETTRE